MVENSPVMISWRSNKPPERVRSHTKAFRNPPQPHMCIQDFLEGSQEPCYINVMSWEKIALPVGPEDSIPLYGGMQVPHSPPSHSPVFAVMANPEVLRAKGKHAANPQETQALVLMMLDFVELMNRNRGLHFARHFRILPDRDLAGELKNVWAAVQMKRAHDTATRASLQHLALQQQQQEEHQRQQQEEQMRRYQRRQQRIQKDKQAMIQKEERYRNHQQHEELQRMMDEAEMEKYLEQRHHQRLIHEHQRDPKQCKQESKSPQEFSKEEGRVTPKYHEDVDEGLKALDYSSNKHFPADGCNMIDHIAIKNEASHSSQQRIKPIELREPSSTSPSLPSLTSPSQWIDNCSLKYREQEYLSTSASESDYTSDDGDATDVESALDSDIEGDGNKRHVLARVTVTVDTPTEPTSEKDDNDGPGGGGDANTLKNRGTE